MINRNEKMFVRLVILLDEVIRMTETELEWTKIPLLDLWKDDFKFSDYYTNKLGDDTDKALFEYLDSLEEPDGLSEEELEEYWIKEEDNWQLKYGFQNRFAIGLVVDGLDGIVADTIRKEILSNYTFNKDYNNNDWICYKYILDYDSIKKFTEKLTDRHLCYISI